MFLFIFISKYILSIAATEIICWKTYFNLLLYELFKIEVPKITQKWYWTKYFSCDNSSNFFAKKSQIELISIKRQIYKSHN